LHKNLLAVDAVCLIEHALQNGSKFGGKNAKFDKKDDIKEDVPKL
jgi:hypothetical protein